LTADASCGLTTPRNPPPDPPQPPSGVAGRDQPVAGRGRTLSGRTLGRLTSRAGAQSRSNLSEQRLIELCRDGDEQAFETIVERYRAQLLRHCAGIAAEDAQDAVQQTFIEAWSALRGGTEVRYLRAWLFTIAHRAALQGLRRPEERSSEVPESLVGHQSPAEQFEQATTTRDIFAAITDLPDHEHDALVSMGVHGRSARATARELGVSEGAVRQLVFRARARVRAAAGLFAPPIPVLRLLSRSGHARRAAALGNAAPSTSPAAVGTLTKLAVVALVGAGVGAPIVALGGGQETHASHLSSATEPTAVFVASPRSGAARISESSHPGALSTRRAGASRAHPADAAAASSAVGPGSLSPTATPAGTPGEGTREAGSPKTSVQDSGGPAGTIPSGLGTVVKEAKAPVGLAPPVAHPPIPTLPPLPSAGEAATGAAGPGTGTAEAVGRVIQEVTPVEPKGLPSAP